jgi:hypothetical protein
VLAEEWIPGLVPVFAEEKEQIFKLRRLPVRGQENSSEPLFFALPPTDEASALQIAGPWHCEAIRGSGSKVFPGFELAIDLEMVAGRFDQNTEYKYGFITGGIFHSDRLELNIRHGDDLYRMTGQLESGKFKGDWRHLNGEERGSWTAWRDKPAFSSPESSEAIELFEWRHPSDSAIRYGIEGWEPGPEWVRTPRPLCRVWKAK